MLQSTFQQSTIQEPMAPCACMLTHPIYFQSILVKYLGKWLSNI